MNKKLLLLALLQSMSCFGAENTTSESVVSVLSDTPRPTSVIAKKESATALEESLSDTKNVVINGCFTAAPSILFFTSIAAAIAGVYYMRDRNLIAGTILGSISLVSFLGAKQLAEINAWAKSYEAYFRRRNAFEEEELQSTQQ